MESTVTTTPHRIAPRLVERPWGATRLAAMIGAGAVPEGTVGEAWLAGPDEVVLDGPAAGQTLDALAARYGEAFVGSASVARHGARMPLLVKLLDAAEPLSVQVHPDDASAWRTGGHLGKDEAWLILAAEPGASVQWGWRRSVTADEVRRAASSGAVEALMRPLPVRRGDVVVNEAGVVHSVGAGVMLYELQQASDLTYRLYDYGRVGLDGRPRELHLDAAVAVACLSPSPEPPPRRRLAPGRERLAETGSFVLERWQVGGRAPGRQSWDVDTSTLEVWTVLQGEAELDVAGRAIELPPYATVVVPASAGRAAWRGDAVLARGTARGTA